MCKRILLFLTILTLGCHVFAQNLPKDKATESSCSLKILSWNIFMLPPIALRSAKLERAAAIAEVIANTDYDIVVFQEAFHPTARTIIANKLKKVFPNMYGPVNPGSGLKTSSGLWILSKIPLKQLKAIRYNDCEGYDCFSKKGAVLLQGELKGKTFQLIGTHLQSSGPQSLRSKQCRQIRDELEAPFQENNVLQIICGDFNTYDSDSSGYNSMIKILGAEDGGICGDVCNTYRGCNDRIDYIFVRRNGIQVKRILRDVRMFHYAWKGQHNKNIHSPELSDHNAMELAIEF